MAQKKKQIITVSGQEISIQRIDNRDYISLSDMAQEQGGIDRIRNWMRNRDTIEFLATWEEIHNPDFNVVQMHHITKDAGFNRFIISPKQWVEATNAIGMISKAGRYGGVYAHKDIAYHFGMWLSPKFSLLVIKEFDRLKEAEQSRKNLTWDYQRFLTKVNYQLHTDTIRDHILPKLQTPKDKEAIVYADEADLLNMAVFGMTAKQWREANPDKAKKKLTIRDDADIVQLNVLANLESLNAVMIEHGTAKEKRFEMLSKTSISQYKRLAANEDLRLLGGMDKEGDNEESE